MPSTSKLAPQNMKAHNASLVLRMISEKAPVSQSELVELTGLSPTTISVTVRQLKRRKMIREVGRQESSGGRKPVLLDINPGAGWVLGVDLGVSRTITVLADLRGQVVRKVENTTPKQPSPPEAVRLITEQVASISADLDLRRRPIYGIGLGLPGLVDSEAGVSVVSHNLGWCDVPIKKLLESELALPVHVCNVIHAATLGEKWFGAGREMDDLICIGVGSGVGAGIVRAGRLYQGPGIGAGEIGHTVVEPDGYPCRCGRRGCLEAYVSGPGIARQAEEALRSGACSRRLSAILARRALTGKDVGEAALAGDELAGRIIERTGIMLGGAIASAINLFGIGKVILGGGVMEAGNLLLDPLRRTVLEHAFSVPKDEVYITLRQLGRDASLAGAVALTLNREVFQRSSPGAEAVT